MRLSDGRWPCSEIRVFRKRASAATEMALFECYQHYRQSSHAVNRCGLLVQAWSVSVGYDREPRKNEPRRHFTLCIIHRDTDPRRNKRSSFEVDISWLRRTTGRLMLTVAASVTKTIGNLY